jgi:hypothetical protein
MADAADSKSVGRKAVWVRLPPPAPTQPNESKIVLKNLLANMATTAATRSRTSIVPTLKSIFVIPTIPER